MPYKIYISEYACKDLQEPKEIQIGQKKHQVNQKAHQGVTRNGRPNYSEIQINKWLKKKSNQQMTDYITKGSKSTQQIIDKTPIENKIPIKTTNINLGEKIPKRRWYLTEIK